MRKCKQCGKNRSERFYVSERGRICESCRKRNRSDATHAARIEATYNLTIEEFEELMRLQGGACAICKGERKYRLNVDHDHKGRGPVRGLLCKRCNKILRDVRDTPEILRNAADYIEDPPAQRWGIEAYANEVKIASKEVE